MNRLWGTRVYLAGPMDRVPDGGVIWREKLTPILQERGIVVLNPADKPIDKGFEGISSRKKREELIENGYYDEAAAQIKLLRIIDLRMVDLADFLIVYLDPDSHMCGTYNELFDANKCKKPILIMVEGGKNKVPHWLLGTIPHQMIFGSWDDLLEYVEHVDVDEDVDHYRRWTWFKYDQMLPKNIMKLETFETLPTLSFVGEYIPSLLTPVNSGENNE